MTVDPNSIDLPAFMAEHLQRAEPDLLRTMLSAFVQALMSAEADAICGPPYGEPQTGQPAGRSREIVDSSQCTRPVKRPGPGCRTVRTRRHIVGA